MSRNASIVAAVGAATLGLIATALGTMYIAGMFGLSGAFASQIVDAVEVGGAALAIVMAALSGGTAGAVVATARWAVARMGRQAAIA
ncbi:hypothetical protein D5R93_08570 [Actinomyces lilanjuaniae]|uniref:Circular bacteriocin, circularin A/uberolysin family n=1 Tax=Actinomyces lilanjuaniae TaxID=2321394 RepID=A0ABN5PTA7_9ACTO|nr:uberolysin/carnocyclin family circular bacteriocin [Actinomyces lilanjuaniae]AYD90051.1 hypothetical protein D5R93_08570 [Actinomyces lilanjuaniae]